MNKRLIVLLAALLSILMIGSALAEVTTDLVARNDGLSVYLDGNGHLLIPGNSTAVNKTSATGIVSVDAYRVVYFSDNGAATALIALDLNTYTEKVICANVIDACTIAAQSVYYIPTAARNTIRVYNFDGGTDAVAQNSVENFDSIYATVDGPVANYVENAGALILNTITGKFETYSEATPSKLWVGDTYQVYINNGSDLRILRKGAFAADIIDTNVYDFAVVNGYVYYLANTGSAIRLKRYNAETMDQKVLTTPEVSSTMLAASESKLFMLGSDNVIYAVNAETGDLSKYLTLKSSYASLPAGSTISGYVLSAMEGQLLVYAKVSEASATPTFTFMEFTTDATKTGNDKYVLVEQIDIPEESHAWTLLAPAVQYRPLYRGSRGDAVSAIQEPLYNLGYYDYYIDGIFGYRTEYAIELLQDDLGRPITGIADEELQRLILGGKLSAFDPYVALARGNRGLRVTRMQQRLRDLGYLADAADGIYGSRTQLAVQLFQEQNSLPATGTADRATLERLYSSYANSCSTYIELRRGDTGYRVRQLNNRLQALFYLEENPGSTYTAATEEAVRRFQAQVGLVIDGRASATVQARLFAWNAPEYAGYITLRRGDENIRVNRLQRRLRELGYFTGHTTNYFGRATQNAVKLFQQQVGMRPTGVATPKMQELLFSPYAPRYIKPTELGTPVITLDSFLKRENGVYCITDSCTTTGFVTFSWTVAGEVASYNVNISDQYGKVYLNDDTQLQLTGFSLGALTKDVVYTIRVTAYPMDGNSAHITSATLQFKHIDEPVIPVIGTITDVTTAIIQTDKTENDVDYIHPGTVQLKWYADGDVASYYVAILDENGNVCLDTNTIDESASISSSLMTEGKIYTLSVSAIPTNGTIADAFTVTRKFTLNTEVPEIPTVDAPVITSDDLTPDVGGTYVLESDPVTFKWDAVTDAFQYYIEVINASDVTIDSVATTETTFTLNPTAMTEGSTYTLKVTAIPAAGTLDNATAASVSLLRKPSEAIIVLSAPVPTLLSADVGDDGISYVSAMSLDFDWDVVEGAAAYNFSITDSTNSVVMSVTCDDTGITIPADELIPEATYVATVNPVPEDTENAQGTPAMVPFVVTADEESTELPTTPEETTVIETEPSDEFLPTEETVVEETPVEDVIPDTEPEGDVPTEEPTVPEVEPTVPDVEPTEAVATSIAIAGSATDENGVCLLPADADTFSFHWHCDGASAYSILISDENNPELLSTTMSIEEATMPAAQIVPNTVYSIEIGALDAAGNPLCESTVLYFMLPAANEEAPVEEVPVEETPVEETPVEETPVADVPSQDLPGGEDDTADNNNASDIPVEQPVEVVPAVGALSVSIDPINNYDGDVVITDGLVTFNWYAESAASYTVSLVDSIGNVLASQENIAQTSIQLDTAQLAANEVYALTVIAYGADSSVSYGSVTFKRVEAVEEPTQGYEEQPVEENTQGYEEQPVEENTHGYEEQPIAENTQGYEEHPIEEPVYEEPVVVVPSVGAVSLSITPINDYSGDVIITDGTIYFDWYADDATSYSIKLIDAYGNVSASMENITGTGTQLEAYQLAGNETYTFSVDAYGADGSVSTASVRFMRIEIVEQPTYEAPVYEQPVHEEPTYQEPVYEQPADEEPLYQEPVYEEPVYQEPVYEEPVYQEPVYEQPAGTQPITGSSDYGTIAMLQNILVERGWLAYGTYTEGVLDDATLYAVIDLQNAWNMNGYGVMVTDMQSRIINTDTVDLLMANQALYK
ncbi:MAG: peptidoglycan-binding protein [Clostridia bacterium]|nr:peptidoglycan-binding protein [Clostridia bacterium]